MVLTFLLHIFFILHCFGNTRHANNNHQTLWAEMLLPESLSLSEPVRVNLWSSSSFRPSWSANWTSGAASSLTKTLAHFCTPHSHSQIWERWNTGTHHQQWHSQTQDRDSQSKKSSFQLNLASVCIMARTALNSHTSVTFCADCRGKLEILWMDSDMVMHA